jgi:dihydrofolate synthase/folylpolyglutamate synthase
LTRGEAATDSIAYLFSLESLGIKLGLENIRHLTAALGDPQSAYPTVIVGGTNGKGSVAAMTAAALTASGRRTALYTSPHLVRLEERFAIDGEPAPPALLSDAADAVRTASEELVSRGTLPAPPTFFEATTATAFEIFRRARVDVAVLEVGLGGRFDATNVVTPLAAAITSIDLDHVDLLGSTLGEIAREKAGIIKPDVPVVVGERKPIPRGVIEAASAERGAPFIGAFDGADVHIRMEAGRARIDLRTPHDVYNDVPLSLRGRHQVDNAVVSVRLLEALNGAGMPVPRDAVVKGLSSAVWPGRLELVDALRIGRPGRDILLDAAHNPAGARALAAYLAEWHPGGMPIVFGAMKDKDASAMIAALRSEAAGFHFTRAQTGRAEDPRVLADAAARVAPGVPIDVHETPRRALERALDANISPAVCAGSIFLVGEVRAILC